MHVETLGDAIERHGVADIGLGDLAGDDLAADREVLGGEDVALLAVDVLHQRDAAVAVGIVFDRRDGALDAELAALEVDQSVQAIVATALVANGDAALIVAASVVFDALDEGLLGSALGDLGEVGHRCETGAVRRGME